MSESNAVHNGWGDREVVITGVGMVTPIGVSTMETWRALCFGDNGIGPITRFDASAFPVQFAAECRDIEVIGHEDFSAFGQRIVATQKGKLAFAAAQEAWLMACVDEQTAQKWVEDKQLGVCLGSEAGRPDLATVATQIRDAVLPTEEDLELLAPMAPATLVAELLNATGPVSVVSTACTSSSQAIGEGVFRIRRGEVEADGIWESKYKAKNMGDDGSTLGIGTGEKIALGGKNKFEDVLDGGEDSDLLKLTDTSDAFFLHDSFSGFYEEVDKSSMDHAGMASAKRVLSVETIDAGGGDDIVDLTSSLFNMDEISGMVVEGGLGNDVIWASSGDDDLRGGEGHDILFGGKGTDTLTGGSGSDVFQFTLSSGQDTITDFNISEGDKIQLWKGSNDSNTVTYTQNGNDTIITWQDVRIDVNMDHTVAAQHVEWMTIV